MNDDQLLEQLDKRFNAIEKNMATKDDLKYVATKADIQKLDQGQEQTNKRLSALEDQQTHIITAGEAIKAGQDDMRDKMATEAGMMDLGAKMDKVTRNHERRITNLEEHTGASNPTKN